MPISTLTLLRHAKSSWKNQHQLDSERPLNSRGNTDAIEMAKRLLDRQSVPDYILSSSAVRTRQTTAHLLTVFSATPPQVAYEDSLYLASPLTLLGSLVEVPDAASHVMIVAHNPGIEELSATLTGISFDVMPTAALRQFACSNFEAILAALLNDRLTLSAAIKAASGSVELIHSDYPKSRAEPSST